MSSASISTEVFKKFCAASSWRQSHSQVMQTSDTDYANNLDYLITLTILKILISFTIEQV